MKSYLTSMVVAIGLGMISSVALAAPASLLDPQPSYTAQPIAPAPGTTPVTGSYGYSTNVAEPQGGTYPPGPFSAVPQRGPVTYEMTPGGNRYHEVIH